MFTKILIANRGEIACRVIRTAQKMGIETVAIYSTVDSQSQHVLMADQAYCVGEAQAKSSYLNIPAIIKAAKTSGAEAIHPGYGFLSENTEFAKACEKAGIIFIGPSVEAMEAMASKQLAKQLLEKTKVPLTPGYHGNDQSDATLFAEAKKIGFPVLLKAASGGGGKGMRAVHNPDDFTQALAGARRESMSSFADDTMIIEKLITNPRHVEVQIMADNHGQVVHLFERDCSIQRRHQKVIEEAPAPGLSPKLRKGLTQAACEVALSIKYRGAGTVEFLVSDKQEFYFMEMNTRLQVEHPVTEMITGLDLVAWQLAIAANEHLPLKQEDIHEKGHAIECRIYAEDPEQNFIPSIGTLRYLSEPHGEGIRIDSGVKQGSAITMYYDPMIAKLISYGNSREEALQKLQRALTHYYVGGVKTNIPFLKAICQHPQFIKAKLSTDFLTKESVNATYPDLKTTLFFAASYDYLTLHHQNHDPLINAAFAWKMHLNSIWLWRYQLDKELLEVKIQPMDQQHFKIQIDQDEFTIKAILNNHHLRIETDKQIFQAEVESHKNHLTFYSEQGQITLSRYQWDSLSSKKSVEKGQLTAPMPATVVAILKNRGESVKAGDKLIILEAMKMEHTIHAPVDGILTDLFYDVGSQVNEGAELLSLEELPK